MSKAKKIIQLWTGHLYPKSTQKEFNRWFSAPNKSEEKDEALAEFWDSTRELAGQYSAEDYANTLARIRALEPKRTKIPLVRRSIAAAAMIAVPLLSVVFSYLYTHSRSKDPVPNMVECYVPNGQTRRIVLPDSSVVNLNAGTLLIYPEKFVAQTRHVFLSGEAIFEVSHDPDKPFVVKTSDVGIEVLGTVFNVSAYADNQIVATTLRQGSVKVNIVQTGGFYTLVPNQQIVYHRTTHEYEIRNVDDDKAFGWERGELLLEEFNIHQIIKTVERRYGVNVYLSSAKYDNARITAKFINEETVIELMSVIRDLIPGLDYRIDGNNVYIY